VQKRVRSDHNDQFDHIQNNGRHEDEDKNSNINQGMESEGIQDVAQTFLHQVFGAVERSEQKAGQPDQYE
jgi:hypothetical protein